MAAQATERWSPRRSSRGADLRWSALREFDVINADTEADCYTAAITLSDLPNTGVIPVMNEQHPLYQRLLVDNVSVATAGLGLFRVTVSYSIPLNGSTHNEDDDKLSQPVRWRWLRSNIDEQVDRDYLGNPIVNSAREPFSEPATRTFTRRILELRRYEPFYDVGKAEAFENTVNNATFTIPGLIVFGARAVRCNLIVPTEEYKVGDTVIDVSYQFEVRQDGWRSRHLDQGFNVHVGDSGGDELQPLYFENGERITMPALLDGRGKAINETLLAGSHKNPVTQVAYEDPPTGAQVELIAQPGVMLPTAIYLRYQLDPETNFAGLGF